MTRLIVVRSGKTDWNSINRIQGACDIPLNEKGRENANRVSSDLCGMKIGAIYSSGLSRSYETAIRIAEAHKLKPKKMQELNEINQGLWQGLCIKDIKKRYKKQYDLWRLSPSFAKPPQGQSIKEAYDNIVNTVQKILEKHSNDTICLVSHEIVISLIKCHFKNENINNLWRIAPKTGEWEVIDI